MTTQNLRSAARSTLSTSAGPLTYYRLQSLEDAGLVQLNRLPFSIRVLLENMLRKEDGYLVTEDDIRTVAAWNPTSPPRKEVPFMPARVLLQDLTGVPVVVDLAAMRSAMARMGGDPQQINPLVPVDLVIDHSVQVDFFGNELAYQRNVGLEFGRNTERYTLLRWAQRAFQNFRLVPPGTGICHQVNLEYLADVVHAAETPEGRVAYYDTVVGTDSHTPMINGLSVLGWGVGGIEAEAVMLGQPYYMVLPEVIGVRLTGALREGVTATDLVLRVTEMLRARGVVEKFVEYFGVGLSRLPLADRATISNMSPEYGATCGFFPIDAETINYLRGTGRPAEVIERVELYAKAQGMFRTDDTPDPQYTDVMELDMSTVEPALSGPRRPQDRIDLTAVKMNWEAELAGFYKKSEHAGPQGQGVTVQTDSGETRIDHGSVVIAAITSCTNTSNPSVMVGAGLLARNAVARGLQSKPWVKTSMAPGSRVVHDYLEQAGVMPALSQLGFDIVGYGCTTCIGNSGPLPEEIGRIIDENDLVAAAVLSGNRNFEGRVHQQVKANYLASPMLVVAYALTGRMDVDLTTEPVGTDGSGQAVFLRDIWPSQQEVSAAVSGALNAEMYSSRYREVSDGDETWRNLPVPEGELYNWQADSTYIQEVPFFKDLSMEPAPLTDIRAARALAVLGDSITTDHISPAGAFGPRSVAGQYLLGKGIAQADFNTYGARRGNHEVMMRGTFANIRLRNAMTPDVEGDWTKHLPDGEQLHIFDASMKYQAEGVPLVILAGKEYGSGSSRDWAAKGPALLGVRAAIAESFERIHRSNLIGMGVLPLVFKPGQNAKALGLTGTEVFDIGGIAEGMTPGKTLTVNARRDNGEVVSFEVTARLDTPVEIDYYRQGGVLHTVLRRILRDSGAQP